MKKAFYFLLILSLIVFMGCRPSYDDGYDRGVDEDFEYEEVVSDDEDSESEDEPEEDLEDDDAPEDDDSEDEDDEPRAVYTGQNFIRLISPDPGTAFLSTPISFRGNVSPNTVKIVISAEGGVEGCPNSMNNYTARQYCYSDYTDLYTLQSFDIGDTEFVYRAAPKWNNLTEGPNTYEFTAVFDDGTKKTLPPITIYYGVQDWPYRY